MLQRRLERLLWTGGALCLTYCVCVSARGVASRRAADRMVQAASVASGPAMETGATTTETGLTTETAAKPASEEDEVIGRIDIPVLKLSAPITSDDDPESLRRGVGHIRGTAMPGGLGTAGLAGHRDSYFRPLRHIAAQTQILLSDKTGTYRYTVDSTEIVMPDRVDVLAVTERPGLTLVTCYPFDYIGPAPKRFIVHAHLLSAVPERERGPSQ
ncbi:MAG: class D sortase [Edaphobacter sp.]|uniref:class D sortase n=1 Tax=Edaphobacter sp. TaxID=1934404 RepID=UPI0023877C48|nr:class D sortase [Edaphobacter sp.]MDE1176956.1 class D sortase [Edaphobacter sp.]